MPIISDTFIRARYATYGAIQRMLESGKAATEKAALSLIVARTKAGQRACCGFVGSDIERIYAQYKSFKYRMKQLRAESRQDRELITSNAI